jgi:N-dimethylarginine dimethylaminohydrolase
LVFTANAGCVRRQVFVPSNFRHPERQRETPVFVQWFASQGWQVQPLGVDASFEGAGDALFCGKLLFAGYLNRSDVASHAALGEAFACEVLSLELVDPRFYHLDTCFCPLAPGQAIYYPAAFDDYGRKVLAENVSTLVAVEEDEAAKFACNAVVVGTPLGEFLKSGGSAKCLTLRLDGEEAAVWE